MDLPQPPPFLVRYLPPPSPERAHITLTWAQSLDARIAGEGGKRVQLSGPESMLMTHWLRTMHDAILVGVNTIILDDPRLKINLIPAECNCLPPQPLILDPSLRFPLTARLLTEWHARGDRTEVVRQPWVICGDTVPRGRVEEAEKAGVRVIQTRLVDGRIPPKNLPTVLQTVGLRSVMIEGGSRVLSAFLHSPPRDDGSPVVDSVVVTVAPMFIGNGVGVVPDDERNDLPPLETVYTETMGQDAVMVCRIRP